MPCPLTICMRCPVSPMRRSCSCAESSSHSSPAEVLRPENLARAFGLDITPTEATPTEATPAEVTLTEEEAR